LREKLRRKSRPFGRLFFFACSVPVVVREKLFRKKVDYRRQGKRSANFNAATVEKALFSCRSGTFRDIGQSFV
jgi:hypothetical protein